MTIEQAISERVKALVNTSPATAPVHLDILPGSPVYPAVCVRLITEETFYTLDGTVRLGRALIQVDAFAREGNGNDPYADAIDLATVIHGRPGVPGLSGWRGRVNADATSPPPELEILGVFREDRRRQYDPDAVSVVTVQQDYRCFYRPLQEGA